MKICILCEEGHVELKDDPFEYTYLGHTTQIGAKYWECNFCHSEFAGMNEHDDIVKSIKEFRRSVEMLGIE